jgi:hypothetical protein
LRHYERRAREARKGVWAPSSQKNPQVAAARSGSEDDRSSSTSGETTVYVTKTGRKYHRENCQHLKKSSRAMTLKQALEQGYEPCSRCKPPTREDP